MKNLPTARFHTIPFLIADLARGKDYYVYTAKGRFKKGANRLCTTLMTAIRAVKSGNDEASHARTLTLIADNFSENKNNTLFAFCTDLVYETSGPKFCNTSGAHDECTCSKGLAAPVGAMAEATDDD